MNIDDKMIDYIGELARLKVKDDERERISIRISKGHQVK